MLHQMTPATRPAAKGADDSTLTSSLTVAVDDLASR